MLIVVLNEDLQGEFDQQTLESLSQSLYHMSQTVLRGSQTLGVNIRSGVRPCLIPRDRLDEMTTDVPYTVCSLYSTYSGCASCGVQLKVNFNISLFPINYI